MTASQDDIEWLCDMAYKIINKSDFNTGLNDVVRLDKIKSDLILLERDNRKLRISLDGVIRAREGFKARVKEAIKTVKFGNYADFKEKRINKEEYIGRNSRLFDVEKELGLNDD